MANTFTERALVETNTGTLAVQYREENHQMTVIVHGHDPRDLRGRAMITLDRMTVLVDDDRWAGVVGHMVCLEGGTELDIDDGRLDQALEGSELDRESLFEDDLIPVIVRDIYLPPARALVRWGDLRNRVNVIEQGDGVRSSGNRVECPLNCGRCLSCYYRRWAARARKHGLLAITGGYDADE